MVQGYRLSLQGHLHTSLQGSDHPVRIPAVWLPFFHRNLFLTAPMPDFPPASPTPWLLLIMYVCSPMSGFNPIFTLQMFEILLSIGLLPSFNLSCLCNYAII